VSVATLRSVLLTPNILGADGVSSAAVNMRPPNAPTPRVEK
jgi:hypothetical protein